MDTGETVIIYSQNRKFRKTTKDGENISDIFIMTKIVGELLEK